jgi:hypothetical protein
MSLKLSDLKKLDSDFFMTLWNTLDFTSFNDPYNTN